MSQLNGNTFQPVLRWGGFALGFFASIAVRGGTRSDLDQRQITTFASCYYGRENNSLGIRSGIRSLNRPARPTKTRGTFSPLKPFFFSFHTRVYLPTCHVSTRPFREGEREKKITCQQVDWFVFARAHSAWRDTTTPSCVLLCTCIHDSEGESSTGVLPGCAVPKVSRFWDGRDV